MVVKHRGHALSSTRGELTRREFARAAAIGLAGLGFGGTARTLLSSVTLEKYVDPLPRIPVAIPRRSAFPGADRYELTMLERPWRFHRDLWEYVNTTMDTHPMHVHLVRFQVHDRQRADTAAYRRDYHKWLASGRAQTKPLLARYLTGDPIPPAAEENGWKDTFKAFPNMVSRIIATFDLPDRVPGMSGTASRTPAEYVHHCHVLEHEDNEMMRPWQVIG